MSTNKKILLGILLAQFSQAGFSQSNPFKMGTGVHELGPTAADDLGVTQEVQDQNLQTALDEAQRQGPDTATKTYVDAAKTYVLGTGYKRKRLLSILAINQGLELAYGIPDPVRDEVVVPALIGYDINADLKNTILRDSIQMAVDFSKRSDHQADLTHLEYEDLATLRLVRGQAWALQAFTPEATYGILRGVLFQWINLLEGTDFQYPERWGTQIVVGNGLIKECQKTPKDGALLRKCSEKVNNFLTGLLQASKIPEHVVILENYETQRNQYFKSLDVWEALDIMKSAGETLIKTSGMTTPKIYEEDRRLWEVSKRLADPSLVLGSEHFARLREYLFRSDTTKMSLHAAYIIAIKGNETQRNWIVQKAQKVDNALQVRDLLKIANDPVEAQHLLNLSAP